MTNLMELKNITLNLSKDFTLNIEKLNIIEGEILGLLGPNGSGKSTLIKIIGLLNKPDKGEIIFNGRKIFPPKKFSLKNIFFSNDIKNKQSIVTVFQEPFLLNTSVYNNIALGLKLRKINKKEIKKIVNHWLSILGIEYLASKHSKKISRGESQRVNLARAFIIKPKLILLDEPFSTLDTPTKNNLLYELKSIIKETKTTAVFVTHDKNEALSMVDRVAILINGKIQQIGNPTDVFLNPVNKEVAEFIGIENILPGVVTEIRDEISVVKVDKSIINVAFPLNIGDKVLVCISPENLTINLKKLSNSSALNQLSGKITTITPLMHFYSLTIDCGMKLKVYITSQSIKKLKLKVGSKIFVSFKSTAVHIIKQ